MLTQEEIEFKNKVRDYMLSNGCSLKFIERELTDSSVKYAIYNGFSPESLGWALIQ